MASVSHFIFSRFFITLPKTYRSFFGFFLQAKIKAVVLTKDLFGYNKNANIASIMLSESRFLDYMDSPHIWVFQKTLKISITIITEIIKASP